MSDEERFRAMLENSEGWQQLKEEMSSWPPEQKAAQREFNARQLDGEMYLDGDTDLLDLLEPFQVVGEIPESGGLVLHQDGRLIAIPEEHFHLKHEPEGRFEIMADLDHARPFDAFATQQSAPEQAAPARGAAEQVIEHDAIDAGLDDDMGLE